MTNPHPRTPFAGYEALMIQGEFMIFYPARGEWHIEFSAPITLDEARALRDMFGGYVKLLETSGITE